MQGLETGGESLTTEPLLPDYQTDEIIEAVIITGPPTTTSSSTVTPGTVPATGVAQQNVNSSPVTVVINANGATITNVSVNGITVGTAAGTYTVPAFGAISIAYSVATPTWVWTLTTTVAATCTLQLGKRTWNLTMPASGVLSLTPVNIKLGRNDNRQLTSTVAGNWSFELSGYADIPRYLRV